MKLRYLLILLYMLHTGLAQAEEVLSANVRDVLLRNVSDQARFKTAFVLPHEADVWLNEMSRRLEKHIPDAGYRADFLKTVYYEATRVGLDPQLVLGLIEVKSGFNKRAVSTTGARGYMQVMPFWLNLIGQHKGSLFHMRTNLRYGCTILRHYLDMGDLYCALGRYDGSLGKAEFPNKVNAAWDKYRNITPTLLFPMPGNPYGT